MNLLLIRDYVKSCVKKILISKVMQVFQSLMHFIIEYKKKITFINIIIDLIREASSLRQLSKWCFFKAWIL